MLPLKVVKTSLSQAERERRREARYSVVLPLRLTTGSGETIPAVILNVSASGLLILADIRFSPILPPPLGARFDAEFFFTDIAATRLTLEVIRVESRDHNQFVFGCKFIDPPPTLLTKIRSQVKRRRILPR